MHQEDGIATESLDKDLILIVRVRVFSIYKKEDKTAII